MENSRHIIIVGGGIAGLSAAWHLTPYANEQFAITIVEGEEQLGGKMVTKQVTLDGGKRFIIDGGPESFVTRKPEAWLLAQELGLEDRIMNPGSETRNMYVLDNGVVTKIPLSPPAFIRSKLLTTRGKLRMVVEPFIPPKRDWEDESLADFVTRRLGREALEKMLGPVLAGIYNTNPEVQSILTTSPVMREMERDHGSLVKGSIARMRIRRKQAKEASETPPPQFMAFRGGSEEMVAALEEQVAARIIKGVYALSLTSSGERYTLKLSDGQSLAADAVILAIPANQAEQILADCAPEAAQLLANIRHENIGTASLVFRSNELHMLYAINGLMIPRREQRRIDAITWTSTKPLERAPAGYELIRVFFGGGDPSITELPDEQLLAALLKELKDIVGITAQPVSVTSFAWLKSFPQADVGHLDLVDGIEEKLPATIQLAGSSYRGIGVPDCIKQGRQASENLLQYFNIKEYKE